ncbi:MAG: response regulator transcription factor [Prolixibacteraceae bacterium]|jgi:two-component system, NarL family, invasion response regulator UvrY|nr:response regulator transcription factor [Prolixibacteraceae bacterium]MBT6006403.1 response regulator transcription factor [Prolixibacteraceae bacterium]MBT6766178.1 response regulator transcription factor [Prolixibacteraceae bacterium]MBT6997575.1 response regulator transcription factor [Prolixibacteraceae bacterium]MBT7397180.1 response regulator transcription factor [Prolixibacteraceae bacterium]
MISILITDDHPVVRQGIIQMLNDCYDIKIIDEASDGIECIKKIKKNPYDVLLLDISMPGRDGLEVLQEVKTIQPDLPVLMLSIYAEELYAIRALKLGAAGYLSKTSASNELITAIRSVADGKKYIPESVVENLVHNINTDKDKPLHHQLSNREMEVMRLLAEGYTLKKMADQLCLSPQTISTYRERILTKLNLTTTSEIIRYAFMEGLVKKNISKLK